MKGMRFLERALDLVRRRLAPRPTEMEPVNAYDVLSSTYDDQTDNLLQTLDDKMFSNLLRDLSLEGKVIADVGCGTGRHWREILSHNPAHLRGYDVSSGMLARLREKFPGATVSCMASHELPDTAARSCDVIISTLTLGYIPDLAATFGEWNRVLKPGAEVVVTDFHPDVAAKGDRSFRCGARSIRIRHFPHPLPLIRSMAATARLEMVRLDETIADDSLRPFYEAQGALGTFQRIRGLGLLYGLRLRKTSEL